MADIRITVPRHLNNLQSFYEIFLVKCMLYFTHHPGYLYPTCYSYTYPTTVFNGHLIKHMCKKIYVRASFTDNSKATRVRKIFTA